MQFSRRLCPRPSDVAPQCPGSVSLPRRPSRRRSNLGGALRKGAHGSLRQAHAGAAEPRGSIFRRRVAGQARRDWHRVGASAHRVQSHPSERLYAFFYPLFSAEIADALGRDAKAAEGLSIIDEALARSERNEERWCVAELLRIKGELILREGAPQAATAAEDHFLQSLDWARHQGALSWELRTSTSLG